jgi:S1-C subfamily serine protease
MQKQEHKRRKLMKIRIKFAVVVVVILVVVGALLGCSGGSPATSVTGASVNNAGHLVLTLSNGQQVDAGSVVGPQGPAGVGITGASINSSGHLILNLSNGQQVDAGAASSQGPAGVSVTGASINTSGQLLLMLSDGQQVNAGSVAATQGQSGMSDPTNPFVEAIPQVQSKIVRIDVTLSNGMASGSGTIFDPRGYIMTNHHVINGSQGIKVTLADGSTFSGTVMASDANKDMAIVQLSTSRTDFPTITLGTAADIVVGETVMAAGFPGGAGLSGPATFTAGIISAMRTYSGQNYIQTDTPINPGNSGGCLFISSGKMIGIPTAGLTPTGADFEDINLVVPVDEVSAFISQNVK